MLTGHIITGALSNLVKSSLMKEAIVFSFLHELSGGIKRDCSEYRQLSMMGYNHTIGDRRLSP